MNVRVAGAIWDISPPGFNQALIHGLRPLWRVDMKKALILAILLIGVPVITMAEAELGSKGQDDLAVILIEPAETIYIQYSNVECVIDTKDIPLLSDQELTNLGLLIALVSHIQFSEEVGKQLLKRLAPKKCLRTAARGSICPSCGNIGIGKDAIGKKCECGTTTVGLTEATLAYYKRKAKDGSVGILDKAAPEDGPLSPQ